MPSKVQSYFMNQRPILCISTGATRELVRDVRAGFTFENITQNDIVKMYHDAAKSSKKERLEMSQNAYDFYKNNFTKNKIVDKFLDSIKVWVL